jgi:cation diffusion facilitator CzcD-associated flavoprotein CzcO
VWIERDDLLQPETLPHYPELERDMEADTLVVGGGMAGMHITYELLTSGVKRVVLVEDGSE